MFLPLKMLKIMPMPDIMLPELVVTHSVGSKSINPKYSLTGKGQALGLPSSASLSSGMLLNTLGSLGSSVISGLFASSAQKRANETNIRLAREANDLNYRMFNEQNRFNVDMYNMNNAYNTPLAQRQRLEEAGINPAIALGQINTGTATGVTSATPAPPAVASVDPVDGFSAGLDKAINNYLGFARVQQDIEQSRAQTDLIRAQAGVYREEADARIKNLNANTANLTIEEKIKQLGYSEAAQTSPERVDMVKAELLAKLRQVDIMDEQILSMKFQNNELNPMQKRKMQAEIGSLYAGIQLMRQQGRLSEAQAEYLGEMMTTEIEKRNGIRLDNDYKRATLKDRIQLSAEQTKQATYQTEMMSFENSVKEIRFIMQSLQQIIDMYANFMNANANMIGSVGSAMRLGRR